MAIYPNWLQPRLSDVPEPFVIARARAGGAGRAKKLTESQLSEIGRKGGLACAAKALPGEQAERARRAAAVTNSRYRGAQQAQWGRDSAARRWGTK